MGIYNGSMITIVSATGYIVKHNQTMLDHRVLHVDASLYMRTVQTERVYEWNTPPSESCWQPINGQCDKQLINRWL